MASAVRSRAGALATRLLLYHQRSPPHHHLEGSPFLLGQSLRNSSNNRRRTSTTTIGGGGGGGRNLFSRQDGRFSHPGSAGVKFWGQLDGKKYSTNTSKQSENDGEAIASQMIGYAATQRKNVAMHVEVSRVLEQGYNFLLSQGPASANAAAKVLFTLATLHVDGGKLQDAVDVLQQVPLLEGALPEVGVAASQALTGVFLRMHKDSLALSEAQSMTGLVSKASGLPLHLRHELKFRAEATVQFAEHATNSKTSGNILDMSSLSSWLNHKEAHVDGVAAALLGLAECYHIRGHLAQAQDYYEKASALAESSLEKASVALNAGAMTADEVVVRAEAGLGQAAANLGDFDDAEAYLTKALTRAEQINGEKHPRVGAVLVCLADVYAQRGIKKGSGDTILTEGLYRRATDLLGAPPLHTTLDPGQHVDMSDVIVIARARYAALLSRAKNRESEAQKLQTWANAVWKGPCPLTEVLTQDASTQPAKNTDGIKDSIKDAYSGRYVVVDVGLGRVVLTPTNY
ncbi:unnamed protein product [Calypogeia fissa]